MENEFKTLRVAKGYTAAEVAKLLDIGFRTAQRYDSGEREPRASVMDALRSLPYCTLKRGPREGPDLRKGQRKGKGDDPSPAFLEDLSKTSVAAMQDPRFETVSSVADDMSHD